MNREDIIRMAREAGLHLYVNDMTAEPYANIVERFADLVAEREREACAKVCDLVAREIDDTNGNSTYCAKAIRARGQA